MRIRGMIPEAPKLHCSLTESEEAESRPEQCKLSLPDDNALDKGHVHTLEERVITSMLHLHEMHKQHGMVGLFHVCAVFAQLACVGCTITNEKEAQARATTLREACSRVQQQLLDYSLLHGSLEDEIGLHDPERNYMLEAVGRRKLHEVQWKVVAALHEKIALDEPHTDLAAPRDAVHRGEGTRPRLLKRQRRLRTCVDGRAHTSTGKMESWAALPKRSGSS